MVSANSRPLRSSPPPGPRVNPWEPGSVIFAGDREELELDEGTIRAFLRNDYPRIVGAVALVAGGRAAAEDAVQEALARAWERSERGERIESLPAWVTKVALNLSRSGLRRLRVEVRARERIAAGGPMADPTGSGALDARADLARALAALPRRQREVTVLHYSLGLGVAEIAAAMRVAEGTVKTSLFRARRSLARALGVDDEEEENADVAPR